MADLRAIGKVTGDEMIPLKQGNEQWFRGWGLN